MAYRGPDDTRSMGPVDYYVGQRMRLRRLQLNKSQERLGELIGVTFQQIQKYEKGQNRMSGGRFVALANALGVEVGYFFDGAPGYTKGGTQLIGEEPTALPSDTFLDMLTHRDAQHLLLAFHKIKNPKLRQRITKLVAGVADVEIEDEALEPA